MLLIRFALGQAFAKIICIATDTKGKGKPIMSVVQTPVCNFGWKAKDFSLRGVDGRNYSLADVRGPKGTIIMFICNHCPYVNAIVDRLAKEIKALQALGIGALAIMSNDPTVVPDDSFDKMKRFAAEHEFTFPYVIDETQDTARAYGAVCTPDFFGFNSNDELQYRGRLNKSKTHPVNHAKRELYEAMKQVAETGSGPEDHIASMGCSIKWLHAV
jgi:peroxiredoxin